MDGENRGVDQFRRALNAYIDLMKQYHELDENEAISCVVDVLETRHANQNVDYPDVDWSEIEQP